VPGAVILRHFPVNHSDRFRVRKCRLPTIPCGSTRTLYHSIIVAV
jgi:hypothetical protein